MADVVLKSRVNGNYRGKLSAILLMLTIGVLSMAESAEKRENQNVIRKAAVAGQFYPADPGILQKDVMAYIAQGKSLPYASRLLISPHAGYVFSGSVAGKAYAVLNKSVTRVVVIGPSHHVWFKGIALSDDDYYQTPLGKVKIDKQFIGKLRSTSLIADIHDADSMEHCLEVQVPFLQVTLNDFTLVPMLAGDVDPQKVADVITPFLDNTTAVIASSDLSHYHKNKDARLIDDRTVSTILDENTDGFIDGCGKTPIKIVMHIAKNTGLKPVKLDAQTSFDIAPEFGSESRVVGYAAIAYVESSNLRDKKDENTQKTLNHEQKNFLLKLARENLKASVCKQDMVVPVNIPDELKDERGCFVTLTSNGMLRGCIGYIEPIKPLYQAIIDNAGNAALKDPRFTPVQERDLGAIQLEISVLSKPVPLDYLDTADLLKKLIPQVHGVILQSGPYQSTFLPQVWEQLPDKIQFLEHLAKKAGLHKDGWKTATYKVYNAEHFHE